MRHAVYTPYVVQMNHMQCVHIEVKYTHTTITSMLGRNGSLRTITRNKNGLQANHMHMHVQYRRTLHARTIMHSHVSGVLSLL